MSGGLFALKVIPALFAFAFKIMISCLQTSLDMVRSSSMQSDVVISHTRRVDHVTSWLASYRQRLKYFMQYHSRRTRKVFRIGTVRYNWPMSAHASQAFSIAHCTDSEDLPTNDYTILTFKKLSIKYLITTVISIKMFRSHSSALWWKS